MNMIRHHVPLPCLGKHAIFVKCAICIYIPWQVSLDNMYAYILFYNQYAFKIFIHPVNEISILKYKVEIRSILDHGRVCLNLCIK